MLLRFAETIEAHSEELAALDALEAGKPIRDCLTIDVPETVTCLRWHAELADKMYDQVSPGGPEIVLYNYPGRTGVDMNPELVERLSALTNVKYLKESTGDITRVS